MMNLRTKPFHLFKSLPLQKIPTDDGLRNGFEKSIRICLYKGLSIMLMNMLFDVLVVRSPVHCDVTEVCGPVCHTS